MKINRLLKYKGYARSLPSMNIQRCAIAALFLSIFIPIVLMMNIIFLNQTLIRPEHNKYLCGILLISLVFLFVKTIMGSAREARRYYRYVYRTYYIICGAFMILLSNSYFNREGSLFYFFLCAIYFVVVPVLDFNELVVSEVISNGFMVYLVFANYEIKSVAAQVILFNIVRIAVLVWKYGVVVNNYKLKSRTRQKEIIPEVDSVTGIANKTGMLRKFEVVWPLCEKNNIACGAIMIDVSSVRRRLDKFGYISEEEFLIEISKSIREVVKYRTVMFGRVGKNKFLVGIQDTDKTELILFAKKIKRVLSKATSVSEGNMGVVLMKNTKRTSYEKLWNLAEMSLKVAKEAGRGEIAYGNKIVITKMPEGARTVYE